MGSEQGRRRDSDSRCSHIELGPCGGDDSDARDDDNGSDSLSIHPMLCPLLSILFISSFNPYMCEVRGKKGLAQGHTAER